MENDFSLYKRKVFEYNLSGKEKWDGIAAECDIPVSSACSGRPGEMPDGWRRRAAPHQMPAGQRKKGKRKEREMAEERSKGAEKSREKADGYRVIALDLDGTVLNDEKKIDARTQAAIHKALEMGKEVVFCSGRSYDEMADILADYPDMNYLCGESGALVYDLKRKTPVSMVSVSREAIGRVKKVVEGRDVMLHFISEGRALVNRSQLPHMAHYQMGVYQEMFNKVTTVVEDVFQTVEEEGCSVEKINLFHSSVEERRESLELLSQMQLPLTMVFSEITALECSPLGLSKATGLRRLCQELGITMEEVIMVGDADNDLEAMKAVGLAVAMGNANDQVRAASQVQVADNNHSGCAEAIEKYLLGGQR